MHMCTFTIFKITMHGQADLDDYGRKWQTERALILNIKRKIIQCFEARKNGVHQVWESYY